MLKYEYFLTESGEGLLPIVKAIAHWSDLYVAGTRMPQRFH
ncbi:MAG: winged helix-turn-helix transcriptional regulator [Pseudohongiellaceae bacterium]